MIAKWCEPKLFLSSILLVRLFEIYTVPDIKIDFNTKKMEAAGAERGRFRQTLIDAGKVCPQSA